MRGVENALGGLEGIHKIDAPIGGFEVKITPAKDKTLDLAAIPDAIWQASINTYHMNIAARGRVERGEDGAPRFRISGWPHTYALEGSYLPEEERVYRARVRVIGGEARLRLKE